MVKKAEVTNETAYVTTCLTDEIPKDPCFLPMKKVNKKNGGILYMSTEEYDSTFCKETLLSLFSDSLEDWTIDEACIGMIKSTTKTKKSKDATKRLFKKAIQIINMLEKQHGWPLTTMDLCTHSEIKVYPGLSKDEISSTRLMMLGVFKPSPVWYQYNHTLSLFLSLARLCLNGAYSNIASYSGFIKRTEKLRKQAATAVKNDRPLKIVEREKMHLTFANVWPEYLKYMDKLYTKKDLKAFRDGVEASIVGIDTFVCKFWYKAVRKGKLDELAAKGLGSKAPNYPSEKEIIAYSCSDKSEAATKLLNLVIKK